MRHSIVKLCGAAAFVLFSHLSFAQSAAPISDEQVLKELATFPVRHGQAAPTLAEFRSFQANNDGKNGTSPITLTGYRWIYSLKHIPLDLAQRHYPGVLKSTTHDENLTLSFVIDQAFTVQAHASNVAKPVVAESVTQAVARQFPNLPVAAATVNSGAECFPAVPGEHARFCVHFAMLR